MLCTPTILFHRYVARNAFSLGRLDEAEVYAKELLTNLENKNMVMVPMMADMERIFWPM